MNSPICSRDLKITKLQKDNVSLNLYFLFTFFLEIVHQIHQVVDRGFKVMIVAILNF